MMNSFLCGFLATPLIGIVVMIFLALGCHGDGCGALGFVPLPFFFFAPIAGFISMLWHIFRNKNSPVIPNPPNQNELPTTTTVTAPELKQGTETSTKIISVVVSFFIAVISAGLLGVIFSPSFFVSLLTMGPVEKRLTMLDQWITPVAIVYDFLSPIVFIAIFIFSYRKISTILTEHSTKKENNIA